MRRTSLLCKFEKSFTKQEIDLLDSAKVQAFTLESSTTGTIDLTIDKKKPTNPKLQQTATNISSLISCMVNIFNNITQTLI